MLNILLYYLLLDLTIIMLTDNTRKLRIVYTSFQNYFYLTILRKCIYSVLSCIFI